MTGATCDMCLGHGKIIRFSDGSLIRCPKCFGSSTPAPPAAARRPAEIRERKQQTHRQNKTPGKLHQAIAPLWERIFATLRFLWEQIFKP